MQNNEPMTAFSLAELMVCAAAEAFRNDGEVLATGIGLLDLMKELNETHNMTFVFSTHDEKIMRRASRLIHMEDGKVIEDEYK